MRSQESNSVLFLFLPIFRGISVSLLRPVIGSNVEIARGSKRPRRLCMAVFLLDVLVTFVFDLFILCHSFHYVCQAVPLHGQLLVPDVFFRAVDRLQIKFVDSLWSVAEVLF